MNRLPIILGIALVVSLIGNGYLGYSLLSLDRQASSTETGLRKTLDEASELLATTSARVSTLESLLSETQALLQEVVDENEDLSDDLRDEKDRNEEFEDQIKKIGSTVGTLDKLAKMDTELLMKYSKVFFLNEHYTPVALREIDKEFLYNEADPTFIHAEAKPFLTDMMQDALEDGVKLWVISAYRSFDEQEDLKGAYTVSYGSGANTFSADQGYSEHQLGTTVDFTTDGLGGGLGGFETTPAYEWLTKYAHRYGFVLSYPKDNAYYIFEPWHWRFVGTDLADDLHDDGKYFYDLDQREIDEYLISLFD